MHTYIHTHLYSARIVKQICRAKTSAHICMHIIVHSCRTQQITEGSDNLKLPTSIIAQMLCFEGVGCTKPGTFIAKSSPLKQV